ncbi:MAG TPA: DUF4097 family beta strand repeat-containing protein [Gaiellaceae bacterium]|nr:DUF4097 family beta strand repeat-containing protein [Gaiellaceae bacterium]
MAEHHFHTPLPLELQVTIPAGEIDVQTVDGEESTIVVDGDEKLVAETTVEQVGDKLVVSHRGKRGLGITISIGDLSIFGGEKLRVRAQVPHGATALLNSASADMTVGGRLRGLETKTASGDLRQRGEIEGTAVIKTVSGDSDLERVSGDVKVQSVSGDVKVGWAGGSVETKSVSGDLRVDSIREGNASFTSVSGDVAFGIAQGSFLDVDANSVSGDLSSEVPLGSEPGAGGNGDGPTVTLRGRTVSGDVKVFRAS